MPNVAGAWSTFRYNNFVCETNIEKGQKMLRPSDRTTARAIGLDRLNLRIQTLVIRPTGDGGKRIKQRIATGFRCREP